MCTPCPIPVSRLDSSSPGERGPHSQQARGLLTKAPIGAHFRLFDAQYSLPPSCSVAHASFQHQPTPPPPPLPNSIALYYFPTFSYADRQAKATCAVQLLPTCARKGLWALRRGVAEEEEELEARKKSVSWPQSDPLPFHWQLSQAHREHYRDKTGTVHQVPYFLLPVKEKDKYPHPLDL